MSIMVSSSSARARIVSRGSRYIRPMNVRYSRAVRLSNNARFFRHHADALLDRQRAFWVTDVFTENAHLDAAGREQAGQHLDGRGFARAVRAEKAVKPSGFDAQVQFIDSAKLAVIRARLMVSMATFISGRRVSYRVAAVVAT